MSSIVRESSTEYKLLEYQEEIARLHQEKWFMTHARECPECGKLDIIPPRDYICSRCRNEVTEGL